MVLQLFLALCLTLCGAFVLMPRVEFRLILVARLVESGGQSDGSAVSRRRSARPRAPTSHEH